MLLFLPDVDKPNVNKKKQGNEDMKKKQPGKKMKFRSTIGQKHILFTMDLVSKYCSPLCVIFPVCRHEDTRTQHQTTGKIVLVLSTHPETNQ